MGRLSINEVIEHCKRHTERMESHSGRMQLEETPIGNSNIMKQYWEHRQVAEWLEQLKSYKDAEEQGLLLRLPCKVGTTIYVIPSKVNYDLNIINRRTKNNRVYEQKVHSIEMFSNDRYLLTTCDGLRSVLADSYKEIWFLNKEEAEQALAKLGGAE